jgi:hypothetical protein
MLQLSNLQQKRKNLADIDIRRLVEPNFKA